MNAAEAARVAIPAEVNVAAHLAEFAARRPAQPAVIAPRGGRWIRSSASELEQRTDAIAAGLAQRGLARGDRAALFVRPGPELVAIAFALMRLGAVPVLIDPGLGLPAVLRCIEGIAPRAFVGVPAAQILRLWNARRFPSVEISVAVGPRWFPGVATLAEIVREARAPAPRAATRADDEAAILFTSGSTGPAKGVVCTHGNFEAQIRALRELYRFEPGEVDLACFPLFALIDAALGMTAVFPRLDPSRPGRCDPAEIVESIERHAPTTSFGSPAIWSRVVPWCRANGRRMPSLRRVQIAGAPVSPDLIAAFEGLLAADGEVHTPYGATECLPLSSIGGRELCGPLAGARARGAGTCVGRAAPGIELRTIAITDQPIARMSESRAIAPRELGEICARGAVVTRGYANDERATALAKIADEDGTWHRTGDVGWLDDEGRLWFCGRKAHRIETSDGLVLPVPSENVFDQDRRVRRSALVAVGPRGSARAVLVVEPSPGTATGERAAGELEADLGAAIRALAPSSFPPRLAAPERVLFKRSFPVDVRHNAKIRREELARWAAERLA